MPLKDEEEDLDLTPPEPVKAYAPRLTPADLMNPVLERQQVLKLGQRVTAVEGRVDGIEAKVDAVQATADRIEAMLLEFLVPDKAS